MNNPALLLRSALYLPGSNARAIEKARRLPADVIIYDLEDAVAPQDKALARSQVMAELASRSIRQYRVVRINGMETAWHADDLDALLTAGPRTSPECGPDALLIPKVNSADDLRILQKRLNAAAGTGQSLNRRPVLWAMIETPNALLNLTSIAACAGETRLEALVLGLNDLAKETGIAQLAGRAVWQPVLTQSVIAARANGLFVLDGVCNALEDEERLLAECRQARDSGFDGKTLIHPRQIDPANEIFAPDAEALANARAIIAAFDDDANKDAGALRVNGQMAERLHLEQALALLAKANAIAQQEAFATRGD
ncbi:CoA ester lyase [Croceicoccus sp. F390]|uniref:CoA ester lyase n=1 Tax=Croceicoccus esteveae TaxID=3075597 RepID=A0ABU2ZH76_9SPHN|nr:CoA ester lyase [Croceicoccus sp. F390]MDT0575418.1 CoA ester lyase [Croceicoccus sp. F390]